MDYEKKLVSAELDKIYNGKHSEKYIHYLMNYGRLINPGIRLTNNHYMFMNEIIDEYGENNKDIVYCKALLYSHNVNKRQEAKELFKKAGKLGCISGLYDCAELYFYENDYNKAYELHNEAAKKGNKDAWYRIAWMRFHGKGVDKDIFESFNAALKHLELMHDYPAYDTSGDVLGYNMLSALNDSINDLKKQIKDKDTLIDELVHAPGGQEYLLAKNHFDQLVESITDKSS